MHHPRKGEIRAVALISQRKSWSTKTDGKTKLASEQNKTMFRNQN